MISAARSALYYSLYFNKIVVEGDGVLVTGHCLELCLEHLLLYVKLLLKGTKHWHGGLLLLLLLLLLEYRSPADLILHHRRRGEVLLGLG